MLAKPFSKKTLIVVLILAAALISLAFAIYSAPASSVRAGDRSYDKIEEMRVAGSASAPVMDTRYEAIQEWRAARTGNAGSAPVVDTRYEAIQEWRAARNGTDNSYDQVDALHAARQFSADRSYDALENLRLLSDRK